MLARLARSARPAASERGRGESVHDPASDGFLICFAADSGPRVWFLSTQARRGETGWRLGGRFLRHLHVRIADLSEPVS